MVEDQPCVGLKMRVRNEGEKTPKLLFQTRVPEGVTARRTHYVPSRDGRRFLINTQTGDALPNPITVVFNWQAELRK
jgi:hypothetical protein